MGSGRIHIYLHPTADRFAKLPYTVAHEYYHEVERIKAPALTTDDVLESEGKADYFASQLYPQVRPPHTVARTDDSASRGKRLRGIAAWIARHFARPS